MKSNQIHGSPATDEEMAHENALLKKSISGKATARPWKILDGKVFDETGQCIARIMLLPEHEANAALIVQAVNERDVLLAVAEDAKIALEKMEDAYSASIVGNTAHKVLPLPIGLLKSSLANLAAVRGESEGAK